MTNPSGGDPIVRHVPASQVRFDPWALPEDYVRGNPRPEVAVMFQSEDLSIVYGKWRASPGSVRFDIKAPDLIVVERGSVRVEQIGGETFVAHPGDYVGFPAGVSAWFEPLEEGYEDSFYQESSTGPIPWLVDRMNRGLGLGLPPAEG